MIQRVETNGPPQVAARRSRGISAHAYHVLTPGIRPGLMPGVSVKKSLCRLRRAGSRVESSLRSQADLARARVGWGALEL